jgi:MarR family transcriptional regulator, transcriptional regulator for hemolysin
VLDYDFSNSVNYWTWLASRSFERALNDELRPHGITWRQCQVLGWLALEGKLPQADLADRIGIEPPTMVGILDRMERDGWICRLPCPADRRKKLVSPTTAAEPVWAKIVQCAIRVRTRAVTGLSESEVNDLKRMLNVVQQNLSHPISAEGVA